MWLCFECIYLKCHCDWLSARALDCIQDMEKWAKSQNAQKELMKKVMSQATPGAVAAATSAAMAAAAATVSAGVSMTMVRESATADAGFAVLEKVKCCLQKIPRYRFVAMRIKLVLIGAHYVQSDRNNLHRMAESGAGALVSYGSDSEGDGDAGDDEPTTVQAIEEKLTDWTKLACLLCKRQFPARETLVKHQQMSDLHKVTTIVFKAVDLYCALIKFDAMFVLLVKVIVCCLFVD